VHESEPYEELSYISHPFVPHGVARWRFAFLGISGTNVVSGMFSEVYWWKYVAVVCEQTNI
jgi:hypothetical protein